MKFVDEVTIRVLAGRGGKGCVSFRREKYVPKGGPDGGDGGRGGDVVLEADSQKHTLLDFRYRHMFKAPPGMHGQGQNRHGRSGEDLVLRVPVGTVVKELQHGEILADLIHPGERWIAARGGLGGKGNAHFVSATHRVPRFAQDGQEGEEKDLVLELKLMADVGLVGLPNSGKSTLIAAVSAAKPKIADYPFTTLVPNLGVVQIDDHRPFVIADIPGLIEGAHRGVGLGTRFLRHVERCRVLVHLIDVSRITSENPLGPYTDIVTELSLYSDELSQKVQLVALNKIDLLSHAEGLERIVQAYKQTGHRVLCVSGLRRQGLDLLLRQIEEILGEREAEGDDRALAETGSDPIHHAHAEQSGDSVV